MKKRYIIGVLIVVLGVLAGFFISKKSANAPAAPEVTETATTTVSTTVATTGTQGVKSGVPAMTKSGAYLVAYYASGFSPKTLTIKRGKSVHFLNSSNKAMSIVAVDQYSQFSRELNQEQSVGRGGYYDFTFVNPGTWAYMNRNNHADRGTIIVE